jgi:tRNA (guanine-N7-)-methyltransferase
MSKRNKLEKFAEMSTFHNVFENFDVGKPMLSTAGGRETQMTGQWGSAYFGNAQPITLELACGRGEYTLGLARQYTERNFIGVDIKGARIWKGASIALEENLSNVAFLRTRIELMEQFFAPEEVGEIWITFPDPFLRNSKSNRRLTSYRFLAMYSRLLAKGGHIHLKTDSPELYAFSLAALSAFPGVELLEQCDNIYAGALPLPELSLKTYYERMHLAEGRTIKYLRFRIAEPLADEMVRQLPPIEI